MDGLLGTRYCCRNCGKLLFKSNKRLLQPIEIVCNRSSCKTKQIVYEPTKIMKSKEVKK